MEEKLTVPSYPLNSKCRAGAGNKPALVPKPVHFSCALELRQELLHLALDVDSLPSGVTRKKTRDCMKVTPLPVWSCDPDLNLLSLSLMDCVSGWAVWASQASVPGQPSEGR